MEPILERARGLKQALVQFVLTAEGELATALETYTAAEAKRGERFDLTQRDRGMDTFLTVGRVGTQSPLELFIAQQPDLSREDCRLLQNWHRSFTGLFAISRSLPDGFELFNWLTAKSYCVKPNDPTSLAEMSRFKPGDILLTRIAPLTEALWMFSGPCSFLGKLGKPKLAVAIGNFKRDYPDSLYSDAPELLAAAWDSVARYYQDFLDFFGSDEICLPGYQMNKRLGEFQAYATQKQFAAAGIDSSKSLVELAQEAGISPEELQQTLGEANPQPVAPWLDSRRSLKMVMPQVELPTELKQAEQVTLLADPRWGPSFLPTYHRFQGLLTAAAPDLQTATPLVRRYLEDTGINVSVWQRLAQTYPGPLEALLQQVLQRPGFRLDRDLKPLLQEFGKPLVPELPEIASVPLHLHNLFQEAVAEVNKSRTKTKAKKPPTAGFGTPRL